METNRTLAADVNQHTWAARLCRAVAAPLLLWLLLALPAVVHAQFTYTTNNNQITITKCFGKGNTVTIPDTINGLPVTTIANRAFYGTSLKSITIPNSVTTLEDGDPFSGVFGSSPNLTNVSMGNHLTYIGAYAFARCGLTSVTIPNSVTNTGSSAFFGCYHLTSLTIPDGVTVIADNSFSNCLGLTNMTIGNNVTSIGYNAFEYCERLTRVTIPNNVTSLGDSAFYYCIQLTNVTIGRSVATMGSYPFAGCFYLTNISVDDSNPIYSSLNGTLFDKEQTTLIRFPYGQGGDYSIPKSVTTIGEGAFSGYSRLTNVTIPNSVTTIGRYAFGNCHSLTSVTIPDSVSAIAGL